MGEINPTKSTAMKMIQSKGQRPQAARGVLAGALCSASLLLLTSLAGADGGFGETMAGGDTGSLPITTPGDPLPPNLLEQAFTLSGHPDLLTQAVLGVAGTGTVRRWQISDTLVHVELMGDIQLRLDENTLRQTSIDMGVTPGVTGQGMLVALEFDGRMTRPTAVANVATLSVPYTRMSSAHVFDSPVILHTLQSTGERGRLEFTSRDGILTIDQRIGASL